MAAKEQCYYLFVTDRVFEHEITSLKVHYLPFDIKVFWVMESSCWEFNQETQAST